MTEILYHTETDWVDWPQHFFDYHTENDWSNWPQHFFDYHTETDWSQFGQLYWQLVDADGQPVPAATITIGVTAYQTDSDGILAAAEIDAGEYSITIEKAGYPTLQWTENLLMLRPESSRTIEYKSWVDLGMPETEDVREGLVYAMDTRTGTMVPFVAADLPDEVQVLDGIIYGYEDDAKTGRYVPVTAGDVRDGIVFGIDDTGALVIPSQGQVRSGVVYGHAEEYTGTLTIPTTAQVLSGVLYGADGTEYEGLIVVPASSEVKIGTAFGVDQTGAYVGPAAVVNATVNTPSVAAKISVPDIKVTVRCGA